MLTPTRHQNRIPYDGEEDQANVTYYLPRHQKSGLETELLALHMRWIWETVRIMSKGLEGENKGRWGYNYVHRIELKSNFQEAARHAVQPHAELARKQIVR